MGSVTANGTPPSPVAGRKVVFYKDSPATAIEATIDSNNKFVLNIYDNLMIPIDPASTYYVAIEKDANNWVADPAPVTLKQEGWSNINLTLYEQNVTPVNFIPLYISREADTFDSAIILTWETNTTADPDFYMLTGDGSGVYTDSASGWTKINGTNGFTINNQNKSASYSNQVGTGYAEVYFKALYPDTEEEKNFLLPNDSAVGKINIEIPKYPARLELASLPLIPANYDIDSVIGKQFGIGVAEVWGFYNTPAKWGSQFYNGTSWTGSLPNDEMPPDRGYWIKSKTEAKTITIVGSVPTEDRTIAFAADESLFLYGNSYPKTTAWNTTNLSTVLSEKDKVWQWNGNAWQSTIYLGNNTWGGADISGLLFKHGFWINKQPKTDTWIYPKPY
ncbi:hypothetical protein A2310_01605 [candidate division WOR-1 bacterium RIFOXYB2_FULL_37_13]|uniref:Uncharacterized protein n=1 Tax=candidate division WOR-1 bacterium RIFOXYB2_FULL_37_13 TaxID=1802579 RepID=A0A1F4SEE0_UNCSA|nr:MAG: hypothetical protein A2310_01605 [candidate division WOR-1 bacterium RIFOXYB2_FULL_37_13]